jgi:hypothetical protein
VASTSKMAVQSSNVVLGRCLITAALREYITAPARRSRVH